MKKLIFFLIIIAHIGLQAQTQPYSRQIIDSLQARLENARHPERGKILTALALQYLDSDKDSSLIYLKQAEYLYISSKSDTLLLKLYLDYSKGLYSRRMIEASYDYLLRAKQLGKKKEWLAKYDRLLFQHLSDHFNSVGNNDSTLFYEKEVLSHSKDTLEIIAALKSIGLTYNSMGLTVKALDSYLGALRLLDKIDNPRQKAGVFNNLGILYEDDGDNEKAESYYKQASELYKKANHPRGEFSLLNNLGILYDHQHRYEESLETLAKAEALLPVLKNELNVAIVDLNVGNTLAHMGRAVESIPRFYKALDGFTRLKDNYGIALSHRQLAEAYYKIGRYREGEQQANQCIKLSGQQGYTYLIKDAYHDLFDIYEATRQFEKAFKYQSLYLHMEDSLNDKQRRSKLGLLEKEYEISKVETEKQTLEKENTIQKAQAEVDRVTRIGLGSGIVLLIVMTVLAVVAFYRAKAKNILLAAQKAKIEEASALIRQQASQLEEAAKTKARFFANVSHELRTPVTLINGMLEMIQEDTTIGKAQHKMDIALSSSRRLHNLVNEVLDLSRLEVSKTVLDKKRKELLPLLNRIVFAFESLLVKKNIRLEYEASAFTGIAFDVDEDKFEKVINNLIYNAIKFNRDSGWIKITGKLSDAKDRIIIDVSDSGIGIHEKDLPYIFDRFYQSTSTDNKNSQGIGIGLSLVKDFMILHDGDVFVTSKPGEGSTFSVHFPLTERSAVDVDPSETEEELATTFSFDEFDRKPSILIVEDNDEMRFYLKEIFEDKVEIVEASHGREGLKWLKKSIPDLIISDVMMPEMDGYEFLGQLKNNASLKNIPVVMLTARASEEDLLHGLSLGVDDYITKPFNAKELKIRVHNLLTNQRSRKEWKVKPAEAGEEITEVAEDEVFLRKVEQFVSERAQNALLGIGDLADHMAMSERQLYRKCGLLTGMTPAHLIKEIRLKIAYKLLTDRKVTKVSELAFRVGFDNSAYFSRQFLERFGKKPIDLL